MKTLEIGTKIKTSGFEGRVIANENESRYGYCPAGSVIIRLPSGDAGKLVEDCVVIK